MAVLSDEALCDIMDSYMATGPASVRMAAERSDSEPVTRLTDVRTTPATKEGAPAPGAPAVLSQRIRAVRSSGRCTRSAQSQTFSLCIYLPEARCRRLVAKMTRRSLVEYFEQEPPELLLELSDPGG